MEINTDHYSITTIKNIMLIKAFLAWDERIAKNCFEDTGTVISETFQDKPWALLADRTEWHLNTPEAEQVFINAINSDLTKALTHCAIVIGDSDIKNWQVFKMTKDAVNRYEVKIFSKLQDAKDWLASHNYFF